MSHALYWLELRVRCATFIVCVGSGTSAGFSACTSHCGLANVFFRAGEIEAWGRGLERMFAACYAAGFPDPVITFDESGMSVSFTFSGVYRNLLDGTPAATPEVTAPSALPQPVRATVADTRQRDVACL